jgi:hypothetical protein
MVLSLVGTAAAKAYPYARMVGDAVINDRFEGPAVVIVFQESAQLAVAFSSFVGGQDLTFELIP